MTFLQREHWIISLWSMPGFTPISGFPKMWEATGMTYAELCNELVSLALPSSSGQVVR